MTQSRISPALPAPLSLALFSLGAEELYILKGAWEERKKNGSSHQGRLANFPSDPGKKVEVKISTFSIKSDVCAGRARGCGAMRAY